MGSLDRLYLQAMVRLDHSAVEGALLAAAREAILGKLLAPAAAAHIAAKTLRLAALGLLAL